MAATGKTPILLYGSTTATNAPVAGNLTNSSDGCEIAINVADKNLFFKDSTNIVNTVPIRQSSASSNGWLSSTDWSTFNGKAPAFTYTTSYIPFGQGTTTPTQDSNFVWDNTNKRLGVGTSAPSYKTDILAGAGSVNILRVGQTGVSNGFTIDTNGSTLTYVMNNGNLTLSTDNLVIGTSGKGIDFSATADATATSELLADYEEGTWTPVGNNITFTTAQGVYTKIGRLVSVQGYVVFPSTSNTSAAIILGLPYTIANNESSRSGFTVGYTDYGNSFFFLGANNTNYLVSYTFAGIAITNANMTGKKIYFSGQYTV